MRRALVPLLIALLAGCASLPPPEPRPLDDREYALVELATEAVEDAADDAESLVDEVLARYPDSVDGRRLLQNLRLGRGEDWQVYEDARRLWEKDPEDPEEIYLYARTIPDRDLQKELFERAVRRDPSFFYANYGLAVSALTLGDGERAVKLARRALAIRPRDRKAMLVFARSLAVAGRVEDAEAAFRTILDRDPGNARATLSAAELLRRTGRSGEGLDLVLDALDRDPVDEGLLAGAWKLLERRDIERRRIERAKAAASRALEQDAESTAALLLRSQTRRWLGDPEGALVDLGAAIRTGTRPSLLREERIALSIDAQDYPGALEALREGLEVPLLDSDTNLHLPAERRLVAALEAAARDPEDQEVLAELSRALMSAGFADLAVVAVMDALGPDPTRRDLLALFEKTISWAAFLDDVRTQLLKGYAAAKSGAEPGDLDATLARLSAISVRRLGKDVFAGLTKTTYPFVGEILRTDRPGSPAIWNERGILLVVGQRQGGPVEGTMARVRGRFRDLAEQGVAYDLTMVEGQTLRSFQEFAGGNIAGFTLPGWIVVNLDVAWSWQNEVEALAERGAERDLWPATDEERRRSLWFPGGVRGRLAKAFVESGGSGVETYGSLIQHELGHLLDVDGFFPVVPNVPNLLVELVSHGFSAEEIEVRLERVAETHALEMAPSKRNALLNTLAFLPDRFARPPHSVAYHEIVEKLIGTIADHPDLFPEIARDYNILQQLDRLDEPALRKLIALTFD